MPKFGGSDRSEALFYNKLYEMHKSIGKLLRKNRGNKFKKLEMEL